MHTSMQRVVLLAIPMMIAPFVVVKPMTPQGPPPIAAEVLARVAKAPPLTIDQVNKWETELSNWGKWGPEDERGSLNFATPQKTLEALRLVKDGRCGVAFAICDAGESSG
jgi:hypothetical protein